MTSDIRQIIRQISLAILEKTAVSQAIVNTPNAVREIRSQEGHAFNALNDGEMSHDMFFRAGTDEPDPENPGMTRSAIAQDEWASGLIKQFFEDNFKRISSLEDFAGKPFLDGDDRSVSVLKTPDIPFDTKIAEKNATFRNIQSIPEFVDACGTTAAGIKRAKRVVKEYNANLERMVSWGAPQALLENKYEIMTSPQHMATPPKRKKNGPNKGRAKKPRVTGTTPDPAPESPALLASSAPPSSYETYHSSTEKDEEDERHRQTLHLMQACQGSVDQVEAFMKLPYYD